ncbi:8154_t:CDS:2 [Funneliformis mosseae]|uniref:8154_t:CDS:1 n=1 Tax=Funneliformis mosseae TaxID=27381 RepID=A0A9N9F909_FUNMO|nr:8154_t:CDS:2 [Funneliformis mosseae]
MKTFIWFAVIFCIIYGMMINALPIEEGDEVHLLEKRCSFFSRLIGDCDNPGAVCASDMDCGDLECLPAGTGPHRCQ